MQADPAEQDHEKRYSSGKDSSWRLLVPKRSFVKRVLKRATSARGLGGSWLEMEIESQSTARFKEDRTEGPKKVSSNQCFRLVYFVKTVSRQTQRLKRLIMLSSCQWELAVSLLRQTGWKSSPRRKISPIGLPRYANLGVEGVADVVVLFATHSENREPYRRNPLMACKLTSASSAQTSAKVHTIYRGIHCTCRIGEGCP